MSKKIRSNPIGIKLNRRTFLKGAAAGLAAAALPIQAAEAFSWETFYKSTLKK